MNQLTITPNSIRIICVNMTSLSVIKIRSILSIFLGLFFVGNTLAVDQKTMKNADILWQDISYFEVSLPANATTGFVWHFLPNKSQNGIKLIKERYEAPQTKLIGAGGRAVFSFETPLCKLGEKEFFTLVFVYQRDFEKTKQPTQTVEIQCSSFVTQTLIKGMLIT